MEITNEPGTNQPNKPSIFCRKKGGCTKFLRVEPAVILEQMQVVFGNDGEFGKNGIRVLYSDRSSDPTGKNKVERVEENCCMCGSIGHTYVESVKLIPNNFG